MVHFARWALLPALVLGLVSLSTSATATEVRPPVKQIKDDAGLFSEEAKDKAMRDIKELYNTWHKDLFIETVKVGPSFPNAKDPKSLNLAYTEWARDTFKNSAVNGIYVVFVKDVSKYRIMVGEKTKSLKLFTQDDFKKLDTILADNLKNKKPDDALTKASAFVLDSVTSNARATGYKVGAENTKRAANVPATAKAQHREPIPWGTYILIALAVLVVFWLVTGIIRALSGGYGGGPGYAGGGGGGYGGGGGGGFFSSLMGGLFGAAAGMWLYNSMFGHHTPASYGGESGGGGTADAAGSEATDVGGDASGGGGDWGGGGDGGDAGGGGGDWGGGGDAGGGGDWGGGGGDWGGGGGGDWGGGGGGDW